MWLAGQVSPFFFVSYRPLSLAVDELLPAVDVVGGACEGRVRHDVHGQSDHIGWANHPADWQSGAQLLATRTSS